MDVALIEWEDKKKYQDLIYELKKLQNMSEYSAYNHKSHVEQS